LFACACCRAKWASFIAEAYRHAVSVSEKYADGLADLELFLLPIFHEGTDWKSRVDAEWSFDGDPERLRVELADYWTYASALFATAESTWGRAYVSGGGSSGRGNCTASTCFEAHKARAGVPPHDVPAWRRHRLSEMARQASLLCDIAGDSFRPVTFDPALLTWRDGTIPKLAQAAYDERELPSGHLDTKNKLKVKQIKGVRNLFRAVCAGGHATAASPPGPASSPFAPSKPRPRRVGRAARNA
jgi:hypothetical protein